MSQPGDEGLDAARMEEMVEVITDLDLPIDSVVVVRNGNIAFEAYPNPEFGPEDKHLLYSVTKSFTSALIGIAIEEGIIESIDQKVVDFFPEWSIENLDARKQALTIEHLLTMSCGFAWEGPDDDHHTWGEANRSGNPVKYVLNQPMVSDPGTEFVYNGGCSHILSAILTRTSGLSTLEFARKYLFTPLGIFDVRWPIDPQGIYYGGQDIWLTPRDMAKFGQLFLDKGVWGGRQIIPADWVERSVESHLRHISGGYGYQWWTYPESGIYYASGAFEQRIYVAPDLDMVVVFTADNRPGDLARGEIREGIPLVGWLLGRFVLPAADTYHLAEYASYGFSLDIPLGVQVSERGISLEGRPSDASGMVQFNFGWSPLETFGMQWESVDSAPNMEEVLEKFVSGIEERGAEFEERGHSEWQSKGSHDLLHQPFEIVDGDFAYEGVGGSWYCDESGRVYLLYHAAAPELAAYYDAQAEFQRYLGSVDCH